MKTILAILLLAVATTGCNILASDGLPTLGRATTIERESRGQEKVEAEQEAMPLQTSQLK
jgi:hypothetical protein